MLTDNGSCYRAGTFNDALGEGIKHKYTRPYRPQTNGKVERFNRTWPKSASTSKPGTAKTNGLLRYRCFYTGSTTIDRTQH